MNVLFPVRYNRSNFTAGMPVFYFACLEFRMRADSDFSDSPLYSKTNTRQDATGRWSVAPPTRWRGRQRISENCICLRRAVRGVAGFRGASKVRQREGRGTAAIFWRAGDEPIDRMCAYLAVEREWRGLDGGTVLSSLSPPIQRCMMAMWKGLFTGWDMTGGGGSE